MRFHEFIALGGRDLLSYANCSQAITRNYFFAKLPAYLLACTFAKKFKNFAVFEILGFARAFIQQLSLGCYFL